MINVPICDNNSNSSIFCLGSFYGTYPNKMIINFIESRANFDLKIGRKTPDWLVAASRKNIINILTPKAIQKESTHSITEFQSILVHEINHLFINKLNPNCMKWLDEGLSLNFAKQEKEKITSKSKFISIRKIILHSGKPESFAEIDGYRASYWLVRNLLEYCNKNILLELIAIDGRNKQKIPNKIERILRKPIEAFLI